MDNPLTSQSPLNAINPLATEAEGNSWATPTMLPVSLQAVELIPLVAAGEISEGEITGLAANAVLVNPDDEIPSVEDELLKGDANQDGGLDELDVNQILKDLGKPVTGIDDTRDFDGDGRISLFDGRKLGLVIRNNTDKTPPSLSASLVNDTGTIGDRLTADPDLMGSLTDSSLITRFYGGFDSSNQENYTNLRGIVQADGTFTLNLSRLEQINGGSLSEGEHTLHLRTKDKWNNLTEAEINFTLDRINPNLNLSNSLEGAVLNNNSRLQGTVTDTGTGVASLEYHFDNLAPLEVTVNDRGEFDSTFDFNGLEAGAHTLTLIATDVAGNITSNNFNVNLQLAEPLSVKPGEHLVVELRERFGSNATFFLESKNTLPTGMLEADGTLIFSPATDEIGTYEFKVIAQEGEQTNSQDYLLNVVADTLQTTRISGVILNTNQQPIAGVLIELGNLQTFTDNNGAFTLETPGNLPDNTLKIRGESVTGNITYPFVAEKLPLLLERDPLTGVNNVISRPIYLPPIDLANAVTIDPNANTRVTTTNIPRAQVLVAAGNLKNQQGQLYTGKMSITEVPRELTPAALPVDLLPDLVVTIQPAEMVFTTPAPLSLPNTGGYEPGTSMDLWSINPQTGLFDKVGTGKVSADGSVIETISGGIRNSSWHFFSPPPRNPNPNDPRNPKDDCNKCEGSVPGTSEVTLHSGAVMETHNLVPYQSLGVSRGLSLTYDSLRADPRPIVNFGFDGVSGNFGPSSPFRLIAELTVRRGNFEYQLPGFVGGQYGLDGGEHFWTLPFNGTQADAALQVDLRSQSSGVYQYDLRSGFYRFNGRAFTGSSSTNTGEIIHINSINSPFGSGWGLGGLQEIVENPDGSVLLIDGDGSQLLFKAPTNQGGAYDSPAGDFSSLERLSDGTFRRTMKDQMVYTFNAQNQLEKVQDRNGNETHYVYQNGLISKMIDPVGLETTFTYTGNRVTEIIDPAGRVTQLKYDAAGNLIQVIDPDDSQRTWEYDTNHHMTDETDKRGNREEMSYDFAGRAAHALRKDGSTLDFDPVQVQALSQPNTTLNPFSAPEARQLSNAPQSTYQDAKGNPITYTVDAAGQIVSAFDTVGNLPTNVRNQNNLVTSLTDARGNVTTFTYDGFGNLITLTEPNTSEPIVTPIDFSSAHNYSLQAINSGFPQGNDLVLGGVPFNIPTGGNNIWHSVNVSGNNPKVLDVNIDLFGVTEVDTLINTFWGQRGPNSYASLEFFGSDGAYYKKDLIGNVDLRDYNQATWTNNINGTTTTEVVRLPLSGGGIHRLDKQEIDLPQDFSDERLTRIRLTDNGNTSFQRSFLAGITVIQGQGNNVEPRRFTYDPTFNQLTSITDELGHQTLYEIDANNGNILSNTQVIGTVGGDDDLITRFTYTTQGLVDTVTDALGRVTDYDYSSLGRLNKITWAKGTVDEAFQQFEYDLAGNQTAIIDENGHRTEFQYDTLNRITKVIEADPDGSGALTSPITIYTYDADGNLIKTTDALGNVIQNQYDVLNRLTQTTDALNQITTYSYDSLGNLTSITNPLNHITQNQYDARNRLIKTIDPERIVTSFSYDLDNNLTSVVENDKTEVVIFQDDFNTENNARGQLNYPALANWSVLDGTIDLIGNGYFDFFPGNGLYLDLDGSTGNAGRLESKTVFNLEPGNYTLKFALAGSQRGDSNTVIVSLGNLYRETFTLQSNAPLTTITRTITVSQSATGKLIFDHTGGDNIGILLDNVELKGKISNSSLAGLTNQTTFEYDARNRLIRETDPLNKTTQYQYDAVNNLIVKVDRNNRRTEFDYDDINRLTAETWIGTDQVINYSYDKVSNLTAVTDKYSALAFTYDNRDRLLSVDNTGTPNAPQVVLKYTYDGVGNMLAVTDTINAVVSGTNNYTYDGLNRLIKLTQSGNGVSDKRVDFGYNAIGQFTSINRYSNLTGTQLVNGTTYTYDSLNRLTNLTHSNGINNVAFYNYVYDAASRITQITDVDGVTDYTYDDRNQLTGANNSNANKPDETYNYDANGNRTNTGYQTGTNNRLTSDGTYNYEYDNEGNLIKQTKIATGNVQEFAWDYHNRLVKVTDKDASGNATQEVEFTYDALNRRISKEVDTTPQNTVDGIVTYFVYDQNNVLLDFVDSDGANGLNQPVLAQRYLYGNQIDQILAQESAGVNAIWFLTDRLGTIHDLVNSSGSVINHLFYDSFGQVISESNSAVDSRYRFTGREFDEETGLYYYRARYYDATTGRFISEDPIGLLGNDTNFYRYVTNNPISWGDPSGLKLSPAECAQLRGDIFRKSALLLNELRKYDPVEDAKGGHPYKVGGQNRVTKPGGHFNEIKDLQRGIKNDLARYFNECRKDDDDNNNPPIPRCVDEMANRPVPVPKPEPESNLGRNIAIGVGAAGAGYLIYRGIRLIPSLVPPLWPTLIPNLAVP